MNKLFKRTISFLLVASIFTLPLDFVLGAATIVPHTVKLISSETTQSTIAIYEYGAVLLMDVFDIVMLTRSSMIKRDDKITIKHGCRNEIFIDVSSQTLTEFDKKSSIKIVKNNGQVLVHAFPLLTYLGATCEWKNQALNVVMPINTFWEIFDDVNRGLKDSLIDLEEVYGGKFGITFSVFGNIFIDKITGGTKFFDGMDKYIEDMIYSVLKTDIYSYDSVATLSGKTNAKINSFISKIDLDSVIDFTKDFTGIESGYIDNVILPLFRNQRTSLSKTADNLLKSKNYDEAIKVATEINKKSIEAQKYGKLKNSLDYLDVVFLATDIFATTYSNSLIDPELRRILSNCFDSKTVKSANIEDDDYFKIARKIANVLEDDISILTDTTKKKISDFFIGKIKSGGTKEAVKLLTGKSAGSINFAYDLSKIITSIIHHDTIKAFDADFKAMLSTEFQEYQYNIFYGIWNKAHGQGYRNADTLQLLYDSMVMYNRIALNSHENMIISLEKFGSKNAKSFISGLQKKCSKFAENLYWLNICDVSPIPDISKLAKDKNFDQRKNANTQSETKKYDWDMIEDKVNVIGTIQNRKQEGLTNVKISIYDTSENIISKEKTNKDGSFSFYLEKGSYTATLEKTLYETQTITFECKKGSTSKTIDTVQMQTILEAIDEEVQEVLGILKWIRDAFIWIWTTVVNIWKWIIDFIEYIFS